MSAQSSRSAKFETYLTTKGLTGNEDLLSSDSARWRQKVIDTYGHNETLQKVSGGR